LAVTDIGPDPGFAQYKEYFTTYCNKAMPSKGVKRDDLEQRSLEARAKPNGYDGVGMGQQHAATASQPGIYSGSFGTCVGLIVTGTPKKTGGTSRVLAHLAMGSSWADMRNPWLNFANAVDDAGMTNMQGWLYTIDTTLDKDPNYKGDADMVAEAAGLANVYQSVKARLQVLIGSDNSVVVETHSFQNVGEMSVSSSGAVTFSNL
jgi:hypothetical protein